MATKKCMSCGGSMKKYATGGSAIKPFAAGIPYAAGAGQTDGKNGKMKKGGSIATAKFGASTPVKASCKNGMVRSADGKCVMERPKFQKGGSAFGMLSVKAGIDKNPRPTAADRIAGAKMNKKKIGGSIERK